MQDACPGVLRPHAAADGALLRVRLPGGRIEPAQLEALADLAGDDGDLELTSRGNIQLRAVTAPDARERLETVGLLPSVTHERVRNIVASPLSGRIGGGPDVRPLVREFDERLCATTALADLPGRFLFAFDDGCRDVAALGADVELRGDALYLDGRPTNLRGTVDGMLAAATVFADVREDSWRIRDMPGGADSLARELGGVVVGERDVPDPPAPPVGWLTQSDGRVTLGAGTHLGRLGGRTARFVAAIEHPVTITPWRTVCVHDLDDDPAETVVRVLAPMGLIFDASSPWLQVSACVGNRGCARADADAIGAAEVLADGGPGGRVHVVACARGCGAPPGPHDLVVVGSE
ncbi:precorrin-3B synthase [Tsukamurella sp. 8F]|uniref:precorrin-3B synthase n=1 Tax=unclassified Tsukamurella TaxID=2633480 RepID=UPI0023B98AAD|nr:MULTISPECIES: precorrin-3B synthase [unclassified Tsukamurella]MDF0530572.1 precorrin-3B synthase [Tsukamurella sp. 8J]MDF0586778.1 precorrin-3B synthase [Tsukamurella sp. 8F]